MSGHPAGQYVIGFDGIPVAVEDISRGDVLMGVESSPRTVTRIYQGEQDTVCVTPIKGDSFLVSASAMACLQRSNPKRTRPEWRDSNLYEVPFGKYSRQCFTFRNLYRLYRCGADFSPRISPTPISPYMLGVLLGDGSVRESVQVCAMDKEIISAVADEARRMGIEIRFEDRGPTRSLFHFVKVGRRLGVKKNPMVEAARSIGIFGMNSGNKSIPDAYLNGTRGTRLDVLAGLIDTDGSMHFNGFDFISKSPFLAYDVAFLSRSLGLAAYVNPCVKSSQTGFEGIYFRVGISGNTDIVPCRVPRKIATKRVIYKNALRVGLKVAEAGKRLCFGFDLDGDGRYLLDDFTVMKSAA